MRRAITRSELRDEGEAIMRRVAAGERFTVTVDGTPVADPDDIAVLGVGPDIADPDGLGRARR